MDLPVAGSSPSPCLPPEPPDAELYVKVPKLRALSLNLEAYVLSPDNLHISSSLMGSDDQRFRPSSGKVYWVKHASVYRVHIAQSRDVVLEFVPLFFQLSQAIRAYTVYDPFLMNIRVKSRQRRPFPTAWSYGSRDTQLLLPANSFRQSSFSNASISCILIS
ncbi:unnamed protein product [Brassica rapa subsp. narinosa]